MRTYSNNPNADTMRGVMFIIIFAVALILWATFFDEPYAPTNVEYLPDEGRNPADCSTDPSGNCV